MNYSAASFRYLTAFVMASPADRTWLDHLCSKHLMNQGLVRVSSWGCMVGDRWGCSRFFYHFSWHLVSKVDLNLILAFALTCWHHLASQIRCFDFAFVYLEVWLSFPKRFIGPYCSFLCPWSSYSLANLESSYSEATASSSSCSYTYSWYTLGSLKTWSCSAYMAVYWTWTSIAPAVSSHC